MRSSEAVAIRRHLQKAIDDIEADLSRRQTLEQDRELDELFTRLAGLPKGTPSKAKPARLTEEEQERAVRSFRGNASVQDGCLWQHSSAQAAIRLRKAGWIIEADEIDEALNGLPTEPLDGRHPENLNRQFDAIRAAAEQVEKVVTACLRELHAKGKANKPTAVGGRVEAGQDGEPIGGAVAPAPEPPAAGAAATGDRSEAAGGKHPWGDDDPETPLSPAKLADRLGIPKDDKKRREALRKRLENWRDHNKAGGWIEVADRKPKEAGYLYHLGKVWAVIEDMKPSG